MQIIKEKVKFNNLDINLKISLSGDNNISGYQQEIDGLTEETKEELVNPIIDNEVSRYSYVSGEGLTFLNYYFGTSSPNVDFTEAGFTTSEIESGDSTLLNSFFILDFYDSYSSYTQIKIFTNYLTKVLDGQTQDRIPIPCYVISSNYVNQFYHWYIPKSYLDEQTGTTVTAYVKFSFYNAKTGRLILFYNKDNDMLSTPEVMYFKTTLNLTDMTWQFDLSSTYARAYEVSPSSAYVSRANDTFENFDNQKQNYPEGNVFNSETGDYDTV